MVRAQFYPSYQLASPVPYHKQTSNLVTNIRSGSFVLDNAFRRKHGVKPAIAVNEFSLHLSQQYYSLILKNVVYMLQLLVSKYFPGAFEIKPVAQKMAYTLVD
jgi:hypothetical protein